MDFGLSGKVALVTGASRGIGLAVARTLAEEGCSVALNARSVERLALFAGEIGQQASAHVADVADIDACYRLIDETIVRWGRLDIVICAVGDGASMPAGMETPEEWARMLAVNLQATTNVVAAARPRMAPGGAIVCISSICGVETLGAPIAYSAAKAALNSYVKGIARPLADEGLRINAIAPGNILVPGGRWEQRRASNPDGIAALLEREVSLQRLGQPQEISGIVVFLASPRAAFITGAVWVADGGQTRT